MFSHMWSLITFWWIFIDIFLFSLEELKKMSKSFPNIHLTARGPHLFVQGSQCKPWFWLYQGVYHNINVNKAYLECSNSKAFLKLFFLLRVHSNDAIKLSIFYHFQSWCFYQPYQRFQMYFFIDDKFWFYNQPTIFYHGSSLVLEVEQYVGIFCP